MKFKAIIIVTFLFAATSVPAQKVEATVNENYNFSSFKTFGWTDGRIAPSPATSELIRQAIDRELTSRGLTRNDAAPDLKVAAVGAVSMDLQGVGPSWNNANYKAWGGYSNPGALVTIKNGDLMIFLSESKENYSVWLASARGIFVSSPGEAKGMRKTVDKWVGKLFQKYPIKPHK
ncbi:MAG TPA: DUF4136 domain-containing protein [Pyrinomonadaceae bacterium]|nr:DUF4136 domain-containing protein [Pyrinomonadaceae bacterium]